MYRETSIPNICLSIFTPQDATLSPELPFTEPRLEAVDRDGQALPGEFPPIQSMFDDNILRIY